MPRLRWARKRESEFTSSAHLAIAFDTFQSRVEALPSQSVSFLEHPGRAYGLVATVERQVFLSPVPTWRLFQAQKLTGQKHPAQRSLTERLTEIQIALSNESSEPERRPGYFVGRSGDEAQSRRP